MDAKLPCRQTLQISQVLLERYLDGLSDSDLLLCPVAGMNPIAWQVGHLISVERSLVEALAPNSCPPLPDGFDAAHAKEQGQQAEPTGFAAHDQYLSLWRAQREATLAALDQCSDADFDRANPIERLRHRAATVGLVYNFIGLHTLMHLGQFVAVRRARQLPMAL